MFPSACEPPRTGGAHDALRVMSERAVTAAMGKGATYFFAAVTADICWSGVLFIISCCTSFLPTLLLCFVQDNTRVINSGTTYRHR